MIEFNSRVDKIAKDLPEQIMQGKLKPESAGCGGGLCSLFGGGSLHP